MLEAEEEEDDEKDLQKRRKRTRALFTLSGGVNRFWSAGILQSLSENKRVAVTDILWCLICLLQLLLLLVGLVVLLLLHFICEFQHNKRPVDSVLLLV